MIDIVILNRNLRMHDNAALYYVSKHSNYIVIYLYDETYWNENLFIIIRNIFSTE